MSLRQFEKNPNLFFWSCLGIFVLLSSASLFLNINGSLEIDEPFSANMTNVSWAGFIQIFLHDPATPLYYIFLKIWTSLFGDSERALRSFSILCFASTVIFVAITARELGGIYAGLASALLASISEIGLTFAGTARPYSLLSLLVAIGALIFFQLAGLIKFKERSGRVNLLLLTGFILVNVLGVLTHPIYIFFMAGCNLAALIISRKFFLTMTFCNILTAGIFLAVWGSFLIRTFNLPAVSWMEIPDIKDLIHGYLNLWGIELTSLLMVYILLASIWNFKSVKDFIFSQPGLMGLVILIMMSLVPFLISQNRSVFNDSRTPTLFYPLACVFTGLLITRFKNLWLTFGLLFAMLAAALLPPVFERSRSTVERSPRSSIEYVVKNAKCGDIVIAGGLSINESTYYIRRLSIPHCIQEKVFPASMVAHPGWMYAPELMEQSGILAKEADILVSSLENELGTDGQLWFLYENRTERKDVLEILKNQLDQEMVLTQASKGYGSFFNEILVYSKK